MMGQVLPPPTDAAPMSRTLWTAGSLSALLAVAAGAFGAHALRAVVPSDLLVVWETGARYHMYHSLAVLAAAWAAERWERPAARRAGWLFLAGIVLFAGSLYLLALTGTRWLGAVTPLGGICFLAGWASLAWAAQHGEAAPAVPPR